MHCQELNRSLLLERDYAQSQHAELLANCTTNQLQKCGMAITGLISSQRSKDNKSSSSYKIELTMDRGYGITELPATRIKVGDLVEIKQKGSEGNKEKPVTGIVTKMAKSKLEVSLEGDSNSSSSVQGLESSILQMNLMDNPVTFERQLEAIERLSSASKHPLVEHLFASDNAFPTFTNFSTTSNSITFINESLNEPQKEAIRMALTVVTDSSIPCCLIHGPPGTGKTATLVEIILQLLLNPLTYTRRLLVCGPSNLSVDNVLERLDSNIKVFAKRSAIGRLIRLGHEARVLESVHKYTLDSILAGPDGELLRDIRQELDQGHKQLQQQGSTAPKWSDLKQLRKELKTREQRIINQLLKETSIVLCTLNMAGSRRIRDFVSYQSETRPFAFDVVIIDEASQAIEPDTWLAALLAPKVIMAGDHMQLPPTITCQDINTHSILRQSLFERLILKKNGIKRYFKDLTFPSTMLTVQYRMNTNIMGWSNRELYENKLIAHESVAEHVLVNNHGGEYLPLIFYDTAGFGMFEEISKQTNSSLIIDDQSKSNEGEAGVIIAHLQELINQGFITDPSQLAIITPYNAQVNLIKEQLQLSDINKIFKVEDIEIGSVDGFQGREKEAILFSFVRSSPEGNLRDKDDATKSVIGFLADVRRTNVALTRAKRHLCIVGDSGTLNRFSAYNRLIEYLEEHADIRFPPSTK